MVALKNTSVVGDERPFRVFKVVIVAVHRAKDASPTVCFGVTFKQSPTVPSVETVESHQRAKAGNKESGQAVGSLFNLSSSP